MLTPLQTAAVRRIACACLIAAAAVVAVLALAAAEARGATGGPRVVRIAETGPSRGIDGFRAFFNRDLDPRTARKLSNYTLEGVAADGKVTRIALRSVRYDRRARIATVATTQPFSQGVFKQLVFRLKGGRGRLADIRGNLLDGNRDGRAGGDAVLRFDIVSGTSVTL